VTNFPFCEGRTRKLVTFSPDQFFTVTYRFTPRIIRVHPGDTVTWNNKTANDGHTVSVVAPSDIPKTAADVGNCAVCNPFFAAHFPNGGPPQGAPVLFLDDLKPGNAPFKLDSAGDSLLVPPPGVGFPPTASAQIAAPAGTTLSYLCIFHAWMQGQIRVVAQEDDRQAP